MTERNPFSRGAAFAVLAFMFTHALVFTLAGCGPTRATVRMKSPPPAEPGVVLSQRRFESVGIPRTLTGTVVRVLDGDTVKFVEDANPAVTNTVRIDGIDAPEKRQSYGDMAANRLSELLSQENDRVTVVTRKTDLYGRTVGRVYASSGVDVGLVLVKEGLAWHYSKYDRSAEYAEAEEEAIRAQRGLFYEPEPTPPWEWRRNRKKANGDSTERQK